MIALLLSFLLPIRQATPKLEVRLIARMTGPNECITVDSKFNVYRIQRTSSSDRYITCFNAAGQKWKSYLPDSWSGVNNLVTDGSIVIAYSSNFYLGMYAISARRGKFAWAVTSSSGTRAVNGLYSV